MTLPFFRAPSNLHFCRSSGSAGICEPFALVYFPVPLLASLYDTCRWHNTAQPLSKLALYIDFETIWRFLWIFTELSRFCPRPGLTKNILSGLKLFSTPAV
jgi:hypothetical protein